MLFEDLDGVDPELKCPICTHPWHGPTALACPECEQIFCRACIENHLTKQNRCYSCHTDLDVDRLRPAPRKLQAMSRTNVRVVCANRPNGFCWKGPWGQYEAHMASCPCDPAKLQYVGEVNEGLKCAICLDALRDPEACPHCKELFCHACIHRALHSDKSCPHCRGMLSEDTLAEAPKQIAAVLAGLKVKCPSGCGWEGPRDEASRHLSACDACDRTGTAGQPSLQDRPAASVPGTARGNAAAKSRTTATRSTAEPQATAASSSRLSRRATRMSRADGAPSLEPVLAVGQLVWWVLGSVAGRVGDAVLELLIAPHVAFELIAASTGAAATAALPGDWTRGARAARHCLVTTLWVVMLGALVSLHSVIGAMWVLSCPPLLQVLLEDEGSQSAPHAYAVVEAVKQCALGASKSAVEDTSSDFEAAGDLTQPPRGFYASEEFNQWIFGKLPPDEENLAPDLDELTLVEASVAFACGTILGAVIFSAARYAFSV
jgi:hypothetical protein